MIDAATYKDMHPNDPNNSTKDRDDLGAEVMSRDEPPSEESFLLCLPKTIMGFDMDKKIWGLRPFHLL